MDRATSVGIDVAKAQLDVAVRPSGEQWVNATEPASLEALVGRLPALHPALIVLEATGGREGATVAALAAAGLPVAVVTPRQVRDCARAVGQRAKTDGVAAQILAHVAQVIHPTPRPLPDAPAQELAALLARGRQLIQLQTAERQRLDTGVDLVTWTRVELGREPPGGVHGQSIATCAALSAGVSGGGHSAGPEQWKIASADC